MLLCIKTKKRINFDFALSLSFIFPKWAKRTPAILSVILTIMKKLCTGCHYIGYEDRTSHGSLKTESALWAIAFVLAFAGVFERKLWLPATIVFAVSLFYTLTLFRIKICVCPRCGRDAMIPLNTPKAAEIMEENRLPVPREFADPARTFRGFTLRDVLLILTSILVAIILYKQFA